MLQRKNYRLKPMPIGAEVHDLDVSSLGDEETRKSLYDDWLQSGVLVFRDMPVDNEEHLALSSVFGEPEMHPIPELRCPEQPLLMQLGGDRPSTAFVIDEEKILVGRVPWHRDTAFTLRLAKGAMLRVIERPQTDGQTLFCDTAVAYDALPQEWKDRIENLEHKGTLRLDYRNMVRGVTWKTLRFATEEESPGSKPVVADTELARHPTVVHPLVLTHPDSQRKCIFISPQELQSVVGVSQEESDEILDYIVEHTVQPQFVYRHEWKPGDLVLWDNRRMMHAAVGYPPEQRRSAMRTTLAGETTTGRLFEDTVPA